MSDSASGVTPRSDGILRTVAVTISRAAHRLPGLDGQTARRNAWEAVCAAEVQRRQRELVAAPFAEPVRSDAPINSRSAVSTAATVRHRPE